MKKFLTMSALGALVLTAPLSPVGARGRESGRSLGNRRGPPGRRRRRHRRGVQPDVLVLGGAIRRRHGRGQRADRESQVPARQPRPRDPHEHRLPARPPRREDRPTQRRRDADQLSVRGGSGRRGPSLLGPRQRGARVPGWTSSAACRPTRWPGTATTPTSAQPEPGRVAPTRTVNRGNIQVR